MIINFINDPSPLSQEKFIRILDWFKCETNKSESILLIPMLRHIQVHSLMNKGRGLNERINKCLMGAWACFPFHFFISQG